MQFTTPLPFREAIRRLGDRSPVASRLTSEEWSRVPLALRERAFFSARIESANFLQRTKGLLDDFLTGARETITAPDGSQTTALKIGSRAAFVSKARAFAEAEGLGPIGEPGGLTDITSERRLGLIYDFQTRSAWGYGDWKQGQDPDVLDEFPAARFIRVQEVREPRDTHWMHEGEVRLKSDIGFWTAINADFGVPWAPFGWGCGHDVEDVDRAEAEQLGLLSPGADVTPSERDFNDRLRASVSHLSPEMRAWLRAQFGSAVQIDAGTVQWRVGQQPSAEPAAEKATPPEVHEARLQEMERRIADDMRLIATAEAEVTRLSTEIGSATSERAAELQEQLARTVTRFEQMRARLGSDMTRFVRWAEGSPSTMVVEAGLDRRRVAGWFDAFRHLVGPKWSAGNVSIGLTTNSRSYCTQSGAVRLSASAASATLVHEVGHALEMANPALLKAAVRFRSARVRAGKARMEARLAAMKDRAARVQMRMERSKLYRVTKLSTLRPRWGFRSHEVTLGDDFRDIYSGKVYRDGARDVATEIWSMGLEQMHRDPLGFYLADPDFFRFIWRTLRELAHEVML